MYGWNVTFLDDDDETNKDEAAQGEREAPRRKVARSRQASDAARQRESDDADRRNSTELKSDQDNHDATTPFLGLTALLNWLVFVA